MSKLSSEDDNVSIGRRLVAIRDGAGLTQFDFAEQLGLSPRAYQNYERGEREMPVALFKSLYEVFRIDPLWLVAGPGDSPRRADQRPANTQLIEDIVRVVEKRLVSRRQRLDPDKKARLIRLIYEHCVDEGAVDAGHVDEMLMIAA